jgi:hypothetical protein
MILVIDAHRGVSVMGLRRDKKPPPPLKFLKKLLIKTQNGVPPRDFALKA